MSTHQRSFAVTITFVTLLSTCHLTLAAPQRIECPKEVPDAAIRLYATADGWKPYKSSPLNLNSAAPTGGPPEQRADLAEFTTKRTTSARVDTYDLSPPNPGGVWIKCGYGARNEITLHKQLNSTITQCTITQNIAVPSEISILCR